MAQTSVPIGIRPSVDLEDLSGGFTDISVRAPRAEPEQWSVASEEDAVPAQTRTKKSSFGNLLMSSSSFAGGAAADVPPGARVHEGAPPPPNLLGNAEWVRDDSVTNCAPVPACGPPGHVPAYSAPPLPSAVAWPATPPLLLLPGARCSTEFSLTLRRHHCRQCGNVFCYRCCSARALLQPGSGTAPEDRVAAHYVWGAKEADAHKPQRVCSRCFDALLPLQPHIASTASKAVMAPDYGLPTALEWVGKPVSRSFNLELKKAVHNLTSFLGMPDDEMVRRLITRCHGESPCLDGPSTAPPSPAATASRRNPAPCPQASRCCLWSRPAF